MDSNNETRLTDEEVIKDSICEHSRIVDVLGTWESRPDNGQTKVLSHEDITLQEKMFRNKLSECSESERENLLSRFGETLAQKVDTHVISELSDACLDIEVNHIMDTSFPHLGESIITWILQTKAWVASRDVGYLGDGWIVVSPQMHSLLERYIVVGLKCIPLYYGLFISRMYGLQVIVSDVMKTSERERAARETHEILIGCRSAAYIENTITKFEIFPSRGTLGDSIGARNACKMEIDTLRYRKLSIEWS